MEDPYRVLGVARTATQKEIKSAYRKLARTRHPDVNLRPKANQEFAVITEAYRILNDQKLRASYDRGDVIKSDFVVWRARRAASHARENRMVQEILRHHRQEVKARAQAVVVVTTLFLSTFLAAVAQPVLDPGALGYAILIVFAACGVVYMIRTLKGSFDTYTYRPRTPSVTRDFEPPAEPYSRGIAIAFLVVGYGISLGLGSLVGELADGSFWLQFDRGSLVGVFLFPPIAVMIVDGMRRLNYRS